MHDLAMPVPKLEFSGNPANGANRQALFNPLRVGEKEDEEDVAGVVSTKTLWGALERAAGSRCLHDLDFERDDCIERRVGNLWPVAAVDRGIGEMDKKVERAGLPRRHRREAGQVAWRFLARCQAGSRLSRREG